MGQKVNATIFRAGLKNSECNFKYVNQNSEESSLFLHKNIELQNYINKIFKNFNIFIKNCKMEHTASTVNILISFYKLNSQNEIQCISDIITKTISISTQLYLNNKKTVVKAQNLNIKFERTITKNSEYLKTYKKVLRSFKKFLKDPFQKNLVKLLFIITFERDSSKLLADLISLYLVKNKKRHSYLIFLLKTVLTTLIPINFSKIKGVKIVITGRFNGAPRAKKQNLTIGVTPLQSLNSVISYHNSIAFTQNGTFGIKVWICEK